MNFHGIRSFDLVEPLHPSPHSPIIPALPRTFSFFILSHPLQSFYTLALPFSLFRPIPSFPHPLPSLSFSHPLPYSTRRSILYISLSFSLFPWPRPVQPAGRICLNLAGAEPPLLEITAQSPLLHRWERQAASWHRDTYYPPWLWARRHSLPVCLLASPPCWSACLRALPTCLSFPFDIATPPALLSACLPTLTSLMTQTLPVCLSVSLTTLSASLLPNALSLSLGLFFFVHLTLFLSSLYITI